MENKFSVCAVLLYISLHSADNPGPFLFTSTSLLLNHSLIIDTQLVSRMESQKWINCTSGRNRGVPVIFSDVDQMTVASSQGGRNTATSQLTSYTTNGLYYCSSNKQKAYFSVYSMNSGKRVEVATYFRSTLTLQTKT